MDLPIHQLSMTVLIGNSCFFTMVAVDDDKKPAHVTPLAPITPDEIRRHAAAELRKQMRREMEQRFTATRTSP
ncbi:hypothetical protein [Rhodoferax sp.]|uniref:hypothetical protein n=1 Tax=Rhodoferax sp. TaxID=50421 RepID=UPI00345C5B32